MEAEKTAPDGEAAMILQKVLLHKHSRIVGRKTVAFFLLIVLFSMLLTDNSQAVYFNRKLSGSMQENGDITDWKGDEIQVSKDGRYAVFVADRETDEKIELYSVPIAGGELTRLNPPLVNGGNVDSFQISLDSQWVVYIADQVRDEVFELYSVPIGGGTPIQINAPLVLGGDVGQFEITPNSQGVVYNADQDQNDVFEVYSNRIGGGTSVKLNGPLVAGGDVGNFRITPNNLGVVYEADQTTDEMVELYANWIIGGVPIRLIPPEFFLRVEYFMISPNSQIVVYLAEISGTTQLYSVPTIGGPATRLNSALVSGGNVNDFRVSPDGQWVVYKADQETLNVAELYSVPIGGGSPIKLNSTIVSGGRVIYYTISPNSQRVAYVADQAIEDVEELFSVAIGGGTPIRLNGPMGSGGDIIYGCYGFTPNGLGVVYVADQETNGVNELYSVPVYGGTANKLNPPLVEGGGVSYFRFAPNNLGVVYTAYQDVSDVLELYAVNIFGGQTIKINGSLVEGGRVSTYGYKITPDSQAVLYRADQETNDKFELFITLEGLNMYLPLVISGE